jgi:TRAP-type C4-dicarboxylate transport system substrate-binding protein
MKKSIVLFLTIALLLTMVVGCSSNSSSQTPAASAAQSTEPATSASSGDNGSESPAAETREPINLILSHYQTPGCSVDVMINDWCQKVTDATDGLVTFTIYSGGSLGAAKDHYDMVRSGTCDIAYSYYGIHAGVFKTFETFSLPMLGFQTAEQASEAAWDFYENYDYATEEMSEVHLLLVHSCSPA